MNKFLKQTSIFILLFGVTAGILGYQLMTKANGYTDPFYMRFTTTKQSALILGISRTAQGIVPEVIEEELGIDSIFNYAFTVMHSPYGKVYLNSIKKKLDPKTKNGIFILGVTPWSISSTSKDPEDEDSFRERKNQLATTTWVNHKPNVQYLMTSYDQPLYTLAYEPINKSLFLHNDGWLEVNIAMTDSAIQSRIEYNIDKYGKNAEVYRLSTKRITYLEETIDFLQDHGKVYLVRLPVHPAIMKIETDFMPDFETLITKVSKDKEVPYLSFKNEGKNYGYTDGTHLYKDSSKDVSKEIAYFISNQKD